MPSAVPSEDSNRLDRTPRAFRATLVVSLGAKMPALRQKRKGGAWVRGFFGGFAHCTPSRPRFTAAPPAARAVLSLTIAVMVSAVLAAPPAAGRPRSARTTVTDPLSAVASSQKCDVAREAAAGASGPLAGQRVLVVGDSLVATACNSFESSLAAAGASVRLAAVDGSSPVSGETLESRIDWQQAAPALVQEFRPTKVVVEFCCNYWYPPPSAPVGTPAFLSRWLAAAANLASDFTTSGAQLWWTVTPPSSSKSQDLNFIDVVNETTFELVDQGRLPPGHLLRWDMTLTGGTGVYTSSLNGQQVRQDGLHLTAAGAQLVAQATVADLEGAPAAATPWGPFRSPARFGMQQARDIFAIATPTFFQGEWLATAVRTGAATVTTGEAQLLSGYVSAGTDLVRVYKAFFDRRPDFGGFEYWVRRDTTGTPLSSVVGLFGASPEFRAATGRLTNDQFVTFVYANALGRAPDPTGRAYWQAQLANGRVSRTHLVAMFVDSPEMHANYDQIGRVQSDYAAMLARIPDAAGAAYWTEKSQAAFVAAALGSSEYAARVRP